jgi:hypothetical protein
MKAVEDATFAEEYASDKAAAEAGRVLLLQYSGTAPIFLVMGTFLYRLGQIPHP